MDKIPFEEQRVMNELVGLWQTRYEPRDLVIHLDRLSGAWGSGIGASFFRQVYEDLHTDKRSKYAAYSASEFKQFLESEYSQLAQTYAEKVKADAERQAQAKAKEREEKEKRTRADFDALGKEMAKATTRAELAELGRKRQGLAPYTGISYVYENHCWDCKAHISSAIHPRCPDCGWYICSRCGSCSHGCNKTYKSAVHDEADGPFLPDFPDDF